MRVRSAGLGGGPKGVLGSGGRRRTAPCRLHGAASGPAPSVPAAGGSSGSALAVKEMRPSGLDRAPGRSPPLPRRATYSGGWDAAAPPEGCGRSQL